MHSAIRGSTLDIKQSLTLDKARTPKIYFCNFHGSYVFFCALLGPPTVQDSGLFLQASSICWQMSMMMKVMMSLSTMLLMTMMMVVIVVV